LNWKIVNLERNMRAYVYHRYGAPDVLKIEDIPKPEPDDDEVLLKNQSISLNPLDWRLLRAKPLFIRLIAGLNKPKKTILGYEIAGEVEAVGKNVTRIKVGDTVYGASVHGGYADYVCAKENNVIHKPDALTIEEAASIPMAAFTALQGLRDKGQIQSGQKVLINGASGGVGTFAVQIAKIFDTEVTGVCSSRNLDLVRSLGADHVIDYTSADFTKQGTGYDLIYDTVGNRSFNELKRALKPNGICILAGIKSLALIPQTMFLGPLTTKVSKKTIRMFVATESQADLQFANEMIEAGKLKPVIDRTYPFEQLPEALSYLEEGHARGKVVVRLN